MEDDLLFLEMEDNITILAHGRITQYFDKWKIKKNSIPTLLLTFLGLAQLSKLFFKTYELRTSTKFITIPAIFS